MENKNAIVALTRGYNDLSRYDVLIKRNISIYEKISVINNNFDVILFHEGNITDEQQNYIQSKTPLLPLKFFNVKEVGTKNAFNDSLNIVNNELCPPTQLSLSFSLGYKHMCHFWSIDFLQYLKNYKYIMRLDEDCIVTKIDVDVFNHMNVNNLKYLSPCFQEQDDPNVIVGLEKLWNEFISVNNIVPYKNFNDVRCPQTNFMVIDVDYFNTNETINNILKTIDNCHGIYSNRWGDLPIWGLILSTLVDKKLYKEITDISYYHGSWNKHVN